MGYLEFTTTRILSHKEGKSKQKKSKKIAVDQLAKLFLLYKDHKTEGDAHLLNGYEQESYIISRTPESLSNLNFMPNDDGCYIFESAYHKDRYILKCEGLASEFEVTPPEPFKTYLNGEPMYNCYKFSYNEVKQNLKPGDEVYVCPHFPAYQSKPYLTNLGLGKKSPKEICEFNTMTNFCYTVDDAVAHHPRYYGGSENICERGCGLFQLEVFRDEKTDLSNSSEFEPVPGFIVMDKYVGGGSVTSIQVTFSLRNMQEARWVHDQLHVLSPYLVNLKIYFTQKNYFSL